MDTPLIELILKMVTKLSSTKEGFAVICFFLVVYREQVKAIFDKFILKKTISEEPPEEDTPVSICDMGLCSLRHLGWDELKVFHCPCIYIVKDAQKEADIILQVIDFHRIKGIPVTIDMTRMEMANKTAVDVIQKLLDDIRTKNSILIKFIIPSHPNGTILDIINLIQEQKEKSASDVFRIKIDGDSL